MLQVAYPDAMTLLLVLVSLRLVHAQRFLFAAIALSLAALTRPVGVAPRDDIAAAGRAQRVAGASAPAERRGYQDGTLLLLGVWGLLLGRNLAQRWRWS